MNKELELYINKRINDLLAARDNLLHLLHSINISVNEMDQTEKKNVIELKQEFYLLSGALAELDELKKTFKLNE